MASIVRRATALTAAVAAALAVGCGSSPVEPKIGGSPDTRFPTSIQKTGDGVAPPAGGGAGGGVKKGDQSSN